MTDSPSSLLTSEQKAAFDRDGFLLVRDALSPELLERVLAASDRLFEEGLLQEGLSARNHWQMRNCIGADPVFLEILDNPSVLPLVAGILGWDIHLLTSHLIVRPPSPEGTDRFFKGRGLASGRRTILVGNDRTAPASVFESRVFSLRSIRTGAGKYDGRSRQ